MVETALHWRRTGTGAPLVLLHGIGSSQDDFAALVPQLSAEHQVLTVDLPGHGQSAPPDVRPTVGALADLLESDLDGLQRRSTSGRWRPGRDDGLLADAWWSVLVDLPTGMSDIDCPVVLAQGTCDLLSGGQAPRYLFLVPGSRFHPLYAPTDTHQQITEAPQ